MTAALEGGEWSVARPGRTLPPGKTRLQEAGWAPGPVWMGIKSRPHRNSIPIKPTRCTNFSNIYLEWNSTCFGQFLCPSSVVFYCKHSDGICHTGLLTACEQDQVGTDPARKLSAHIPLLCVQWKTPDDGQRNCPKHVGFFYFFFDGSHPVVQ